jgi:hypothetical protein
MQRLRKLDMEEGRTSGTRRNLSCKNKGDGRGKGEPDKRKRETYLPWPVTDTHVPPADAWYD